MENAAIFETPSISADFTSLRDSLLGLTALNQDLAVLDFGDVIIRKDYKSLNSIRFLSGGIAGEDLGLATFVGKGFLTAAVLGDSTAPCSRLISHTIKELTIGDHNYGIFVVAQANAELFNFGLATERAVSDCSMRIKLLPIDDDRSNVRAKNSCGVLLLIKILSAMAEAGKSFEEIDGSYKKIVESIITVPLNYSCEQIGAKRMKVLVDMKTSLKSILTWQSQMELQLHPSVAIVILINIYKGLTRTEEYAIIRQIVDRLRELGQHIVRLYSGSFFSCADIISLTVMKVNDSTSIDYLDADCTAAGWRQLKQFLPNISTMNEINSGLIRKGKHVLPWKGPRLGEKQTYVMEMATQFACDALISCERQLNIIDAESSVGNIGSRLREASQRLTKKMKKKKLPLHCPYNFFKKLSVIIETTVGGTLGSIYGIFFDSAASVFGELEEGSDVMPIMWLNALKAGTEAVKKYCSHDMEARTMYYAIKSCEYIASEHWKTNENYMHCFGLGVTAAEEAAMQTREENKMYSDAGAHAVGIWMRAVFEAAKLFCGSSNNDDYQA